MPEQQCFSFDDDVAKEKGLIVSHDLETQFIFEEVGKQGHRALRLSVGCVYDSRLNRVQTYWEPQALPYINHLQRAELILGWNIRDFDHPVLMRYAVFDPAKLATFDLMREVEAKCGIRAKLASVSMATLGKGKLGDGLEAVRWFREGRFTELERYCAEDAMLPWEIFQYGCRNGFVLLEDFATGGALKVAVPEWRKLLESIQQDTGQA